MRVFILEDDQNRINWFVKNLATDNIDITEDVTEALKMLEENKYDVIFLDHDLGGMVYVDSGEFNTGNTVARHIAKIGLRSPVVIHSWNSNGAINMMNHLIHAKIIHRYAPFGNKYFQEVVKDINCQLEGDAVT